MCLLALAALVALDVFGLRWFDAVVGSRDRCHRCSQPWRGEFIANFGHEPQVTQWAPPAPALPAWPYRMPFLRWALRIGRPGGLRPAVAA